MNILYIHNDYGKPSGEEHAAEEIPGLLIEKSHSVWWYRRSSAELYRSRIGALKGFCTGIHNPASAAALDRLLQERRPDVVLVQNIYPLISPSIFDVLRRRRLAVVMRCPNYRLVCPSGLHFTGREVCERCLGRGREWWCLWRNCEGRYLKSAGYALRNAVARIRGSIVNSVHVFLVQSGFQKAKFVESGIPAERIEILPGIVRPEPSAGEVELGDVVAYVGRISPEKGIREFVEAARRAPEIPFVVAGDCEAAGALRAGAPANGQGLGVLDRDARRRLYARSRMIVVPSLCYEGFPNELVQAMSLGKPVVCSAIGGLSEIIGYGAAGLLAEAGNVKELASRIRALYFRPELCRKLGRAGRERAEQEYSRERAFERLMQAFQKALRQRADRGASDDSTPLRRTTCRSLCGTTSHARCLTSKRP